MSGAASRRKGHVAERNVATYLRTKGYPDAKTTRQALGHDGNTTPGDIAGVPWCVEVKNVARAAWPAWCRQALAEALPVQTVVVVRKKDGCADVGQWEARWVFPGHGPWLTGTFLEFLNWVEANRAA